MILRDIRHAVRLLWKSPVFTFAAAGTLALAIGANTAIFSVVNTEVLRFLPYRQTDRLVWVWEKNDKLHLPNWPTSIQNYVSWKEQQQSFEQLGAIGFGNYQLTGRGDPEQIPGSS